ncbi:MAG: hypothetical protein IT383_14045 [Deltaproteobacteria bacterium]|nr:hypothetical protein [Deltaproteobacteria bacterium]
MPSLSAAVMVLSWALAADNELPNGYCLIGGGFGFREADTAPWIVDNDVNNRLNAALAMYNVVLDDADGDALAEYALQNLIRQTRGRLRARVVPSQGDCYVTDGDTTPCIVAMSNTESPDCTGTLGHGGCDLNGCFVILCQDQIAGVGDDGGPDLTDGDLMKLLQHELTHAYGLYHTNIVEGCAPEYFTCSGCADEPPLACGTSDGCDGELMCAENRCSASAFYQPGDGSGIRNLYGGSYQNRRVYWGRDAVGAMDPPVLVPSSPMRTAAFPPRLDCAESNSPTNQCAAVFATRTASVSSISVIRLAGASGTSGWTTQVQTHSLALQASMPPDIAIDPTGTVGYVVRVDDVGTMRSTRVPLSGGGTTSVTLAGKPVLPPRIAYADGYVYILSVEATPATAQSFTYPKWYLQRITTAGTNPTPIEFDAAPQSSVDLDDEFWFSYHEPVADFDFDCVAGAVPSKCTIVAHFLHDDANYAINRARSITFEVFVSQYGASAHLLDADWDVDIYDTNATSSVSLTSGVLYTHLGRPLESGTTTQNTRVQRISGDRLSDTILHTNAFSSDAETCEAASAHGFSFAGVTTHGGYSAAFCPRCVGSAGRLESAHLGRRADLDDFCY